MSVSDFSHRRLKEMFGAIDRNESSAFVEFLTEDASFRFGSAPPILGRSSIEAGVDAFFASIGGCHHQVEKVLAQGDTVVCEGEVTYTRHDASTLTVPFVDIFELEGPLIRDYKIYIDTSDLYQT